RRLVAGEQDAVEVAACERGGCLADVLALTDDVELGVSGELLAQRIEAVAGADQIDADAGVAHRIPPELMTVCRESIRSGLSAASTGGRNSSGQSAVFLT